MSESKDYGKASGNLEPGGNVGHDRRGGWRRFSGGRFARVWMGRDGLRAGWAVLLFVMIMSALLAGIAYAAHRLHHLPPMTGELQPSRMLIGELAMIFAAVVATKVMSLIDKRSWRDYGLQAPQRASRVAHLAQGLFFGAAAMALLMGTLRALHAVSIEPSSVALKPLLESAALWAVVFVLVGFSEETSFRGYVLFRLLRGVGPVAASLVTSAVFALVHLTNPGETAFGIVSVAATALVFCFAIWRTGALWWVIGFHAAWDWSQSFVFGIADSGTLASGHWLTSRPGGPAWLSGGAAGPEGSVLMLPLLAILVVVMVRTLPGGGGRRSVQAWR
nr:hypothetical protein HUO10_004747 [Paraburkholderia busanensis]